MKCTALISLILISAASGARASDAPMLPAPRSTPFTITAYCHCARCCGRAHQPAANGRMPIVGITVAGPRSIPFGTHVFIEGIGERVVTDRLEQRYDARFDLFVSTHSQAKRFGVQTLKVTILK